MDKERVLMIQPNTVFIASILLSAWNFFSKIRLSLGVDSCLFNGLAKEFDDQRSCILDSLYVVT
jgi:hypothetical protein